MRTLQSLCLPDLPGYPKMADGDPQMFCFHTANGKDLFEKAISLHIKYFRRELDEQFTFSVIDR